MFQKFTTQHHHRDTLGDRLLCPDQRFLLGRHVTNGNGQQ